MLNKIYDNSKKFIVNNYKFLIIIIFIIMCFYIELPYIIYKSGGTINLENRINTDLENKSNGSFSMSYVTVVKGTPAFVLLSFILPDWDLCSMKEEFNDESYEEVINQGKEYLAEGIDNAIISAFNESNYAVTINNTFFIVNGIFKESKSDFKIGDEIISINNNKINDFNDIKNYVNTLSLGERVEVKVKNGNKEVNRTAKIFKTEDGLKLGIVIKKRFDYNTEIPISIKTRKNESGSSGGLMTSLAIYDELTKEDITKGLKIIGTGTIDENGNVGEIDGVKYKMLAAKKEKADVFLVPVANYKEAKRIKKEKNINMKVKSVATLKEAIDYLNSL